MLLNKRTILFPVILWCTLGFSQVLDTSDPQVQAALNSTNMEMSPLANFFQKRTPMMDILFALVKDDDGLTRTYVGAEIGSPYENETFVPGKVYYNDEELGDVFYRLNAYNNEIEIKKTLVGEEKQMALIKNQEVRLVAPDVELHYMPYYDEKENFMEGYLTLLKEGETLILYRRSVKKFTAPKVAANSMVNGTPSRFTDYSEYYFKEKDSGTVRELPIHKRKTAALFGSDKRPDIEKYIKKHKPDVDSEMEVLQLFEFIDSH